MTNHWKNIHHDFDYQGREWETNYQIQWESPGFTYEQTKEWIDIGLQPADSTFAKWLTQRGYSPPGVLNYANINQLRQDFQQPKKPFRISSFQGKLITGGLILIFLLYLLTN